MRSTVQGTLISDYKADTSMVFVDLSVYNEMIPIQEPTLSIIPPYSEQSIELFYIPKGNTTITTISLERSTKMEYLPCGLYKITQSICPNDKLRYNFWYVHLGQVKQKVGKLYCEGKVKEAKEISEKIDALEALSSCMTDDSEKRIKAILSTLNCDTECCEYKQPMRKFIEIPEKCGTKCKSDCGCNKCSKPKKQMQLKEKSCGCSN